MRVQTPSSFWSYEAAALVAVCLSLWAPLLAAQDDPCVADELCRSHGLCSTVGDDCQATVEAHCQNAEVCVTEGRCGIGENGRCVAVSEEACKGLEVCATSGDCSVVDGQCSPKDDADCRASSGCAESGRCSEVQNTCVVARSSDCEAMEECKAPGACQLYGTPWKASKKKQRLELEAMLTLIDNECGPAEPKSCKKTADCEEYGQCTKVKLEPDEGLYGGGSKVDWDCVVGSDDDCKRSEMCKEHGWCCAREKTSEYSAPYKACESCDPNAEQPKYRGCGRFSEHIGNC